MPPATITPPKLQPNDKVRIIEREPDNPDAKSLRYYPFYRNLTGTVLKAYDDGSVAVSIDRKSLPADVLGRHERSEGSMRDKWLDSLGEEERDRLSEKNKRFSLRYTLLVAAKDLEPYEPPVKGSGSHSKAATPAADPQGDKRKSEADIAAAEEAHLREFENKRAG